jgi:PAS domain-containing protein
MSPNFDNSSQNSIDYYRALFEDSPTSFWVASMRPLKDYFSRLNANGISDFRAYFDSHPEEVIKCASMVDIVAINKATLTLYEAESKESFLNGLQSIYREDSLPVFKEEIIALAEGESLFESDSINYTLTGKKLQVRLKVFITPNFVDTFDEVYCTLVDITDIKRAEEKLRDSEEKFKSLAENSQDYIMRYDKECRHLYQNAAAYSI